MTPDIRPLVAGNWKMNGTRENLSELKAIAEGLEAELADAIDALICPPATLIYVATAVADGTPLSIGAQDCHDKKSGAYTGDISAEMIADCLAGYVLVGHSERRTLHGEANETVRAKAEAAKAAGLTSVICMETVLIVIHLMIVVALVGVVLLQRSEGGALGMGGGGSGGFMSARGAAGHADADDRHPGGRFLHSRRSRWPDRTLRRKPDRYSRRACLRRCGAGRRNRAGESPAEGGVLDQLGGR
jgi:hypothetical protein